MTREEDGWIAGKEGMGCVRDVVLMKEILIVELGRGVVEVLIRGSSPEEETELPMDSVIEHHSDMVEEEPRGREE